MCHVPPRFPIACVDNVFVIFITVSHSTMNHRIKRRPPSSDTFARTWLHSVMESGALSYNYAIEIHTPSRVFQWRARIHANLHVSFGSLDVGKANKLPRAIISLDLSAISTNTNRRLKDTSEDSTYTQRSTVILKRPAKPHTSTIAVLPCRWTRMLIDNDLCSTGAQSEYTFVTTLLRRGAPSENWQTHHYYCKCRASLS